MNPSTSVHIQQGAVNKVQTGDLLELMIDHVDSIVASAQFQNYLNCMAHFPTYSIRNTLLIFHQCPQATHVAGYNAWLSMGRHVKQGESAIRIIAPCRVVLEETGQTVTRYKRVSVFDVSQTEGDPLPELNVLPDLDGDCPFLEQAENGLCQATGYKVFRKSLNEDSKGFCNYLFKAIVLDSNLSDLQAFQSLIHEMAHVYLHGPLFSLDTPSDFERLLIQKRSLRETEAEAVSYLVCARFGLDCSGHSFPYIARWKKNEQFLKESLKRIQDTSNAIVEILKDSFSSQTISKTNN